MAEAPPLEPTQQGRVEVPHHARSPRAARSWSGRGVEISHARVHALTSASSAPVERRSWVRAGSSSGVGGGAGARDVVSWQSADSEAVVLEVGSGYVVAARNTDYRSWVGSARCCGAHAGGYGIADRE